MKTIKKVSKTRDKSLKVKSQKLTPKMSQFVKMFDDILTGKLSNVALNESINLILIKNSKDNFLLEVAKHFYIGKGCPNKDYNSQNEKLKTLRRTINRESKKLVKELDKNGKKANPNFKDAISFKLVKGENFKENKNDFQFEFSTLEITESNINLDKLIDKIEENKINLTDLQKKRIFEIVKIG